MTSNCPTPAANPGLIPAFLVAGLPAEPAAAARALGLPFSVFGPTRGGTWQADFDLPRGSSWRLLPDHGAALWLARDAAAAVPPLGGGSNSLEIDLLHAIMRLGAAEGLWLVEGSLLDQQVGWTTALSGPVLLRLLAAKPGLQTVSGTWSDRRGRAISAELSRDGRIRAETHVQAERWLLVASGLEG